MKIVCVISIMFTSAISPHALYCQSDLLKSLTYVVQHTTDDTLKVNTLNIISRTSWSNQNYPTSLSNAEQALHLAEQIDFSKGRRDAHNNLGEVNYFLGQYEIALDHFHKTIQFSRDINDSHGIAYGYRQIAWLYQSVPENAKALIYFDSALVINQEICDTMAICEILSRQAMIYTNMGFFAKAQQCTERANKLYNTMGSLSGTPQFNNAVVANLYAERGMSFELSRQEKQKKMIAYALSLLLIGLAGISTYWYRRDKKLQNHRAILNERLRISRDLHDEVGATLSGISMYSHLAKEQIQSASRADALKSLTIMQESAGDMVTKLSDIVWLLNPEQAQLYQLIEKLEEYARQMADVTGIQVTTAIADEVAGLELALETRQQVYLIFKEAINNAVKYSQATRIDLHVRKSDHALQFELKDNGIGFDMTQQRRGNGLSNMKKRADEIGAKLIVQSRINEGVSVSLQCKIT